MPCSALMPMGGLTLSEAWVGGGLEGGGQGAGAGEGRELYLVKIINNRIINNKMSKKIIKKKRVGCCTAARWCAPR